MTPQFTCLLSSFCVLLLCYIHSQILIFRLCKQIKLHIEASQELIQVNKDITALATASNDVNRKWCDIFNTLKNAEKSKI